MLGEVPQGHDGQSFEGQLPPQVPSGALQKS